MDYSTTVGKVRSVPIPAVHIWIRYCLLS